MDSQHMDTDSERLKAMAWDLLKSRLAEMKQYKGTWSQLEPLVKVVDEAWERAVEVKR